MREEVLYMIFLNLHNVYATLDRKICPDILEGYVVGPQARHILHTYCYRLTVVACVGRYYREEFQGFQGVTQGDLLYPSI